MRASTHAANPFEMLIDPQAILIAVEASSPLRSLRRKVCRPLDNPRLPGASPAEESASFDTTIDGLRETDV
jgi:hypothetical protein